MTLSPSSQLPITGQSLSPHVLPILENLRKQPRSQGSIPNKVSECAVIESMRRLEDGGYSADKVTALDASKSNNAEDLVDEDEDVETEVKKDWSFRIGYAS